VEPPLDQSSLNDVLRYNPEVLFDLHAAAILERDLRKLDQMTIRSLPVVQTYFIAESGVIILHASNVTDHGKYYQDQFAPYTLFMDRPYFWQAIERSAPMGPFDYQTEPYIDLGGNGLVITYSKKVDLPNHRVGIICVDVKLPQPSVMEIKKRLTSLGAEFAEFSWTIDKGRAKSKGAVAVFGSDRVGAATSRSGQQTGHDEIHRSSGKRGMERGTEKDEVTLGAC